MLRPVLRLHFRSTFQVSTCFMPNPNTCAEYLVVAVVSTLLIHTIYGSILNPFLIIAKSVTTVLAYLFYVIFNSSTLGTS
jgi:hypothetical protein